MKTLLDINNWNRKEHFYFFKDFEEPFFGFTINIDCTEAYKNAKSKGHSFFLYYLYQSLKAANSIPCFRYRIIADEVVEYDTVQAGPTIMRPNGTFGFAYLRYFDSFAEFENYANKEIELVQKSNNLVPAVSGDDVIHYSSIPWLNFTSMQHARSYSRKDSSPKISFGKITPDVNQNLMMPVSIHVHHALMDGLHVSQFVETFQSLMNSS